MTVALSVKYSFILDPDFFSLINLLFIYHSVDEFRMNMTKLTETISTVAKWLCYAINDIHTGVLLSNMEKFDTF